MHVVHTLMMTFFENHGIGCKGDHCGYGNIEVSTSLRIYSVTSTLVPWESTNDRP
jgi:hypothetical protein